MITMEQKKAAIDAIAQANDGVVTPEAVVGAAKSPRHVLHELFDWDDKSAAHQQRLNAARQLISSIQVEIEIEDVTVSAISYIRDVRQGKREQGYVSTDALARRRDDAKASILLELERIISAVERSRFIARSLGLTAYFETMLAQALEARMHVQRKK